MEWKKVVEKLFPTGHEVHQEGDLLSGEGRCGKHTVAVIGTTNHTEVGVELALAMAAAVLAVIHNHPGRPIVFLVDTSGQRLRHRDEMLGLNGYMAHLAKCVEMARRRGHPIISLVYEQALSGGFLANGMMADVCAALPEAEIRVMGLAAMARVTRISEERLTQLSISSPVFAPGAKNYLLMGGLDVLWEGDLSACLKDALEHVDANDHRRVLGLERGGRLLADVVVNRVSASA
ncbi:MAG: Malonate decarboxylase subunit gamma [Candidatus Gallionella acididurans]|uniref:Malonate decarboxylase subunit gamma n=1 Tax=Candidatus Gallionella acididurans TaxID=1796491 RepID=A0A139BW45_9PROT|nr:MAG: Malonate decarboxylase subunit gamma [Candidatus Gallionella acididurans]